MLTLVTGLRLYVALACLAAAAPAQVPPDTATLLDAFEQIKAAPIQYVSLPFTLDQERIACENRLQAAAVDVRRTVLSIRASQAELAALQTRINSLQEQITATTTAIDGLRQSGLERMEQLQAADAYAASRAEQTEPNDLFSFDSSFFTYPGLRNTWPYPDAAGADDETDAGELNK